MKTEEFARTDLKAEELHFDAHEFDGLRDDLASVAETWLKQADRMVRANPWLCIGIAAAVGCTVAYCLRHSSSDDSE